MKKIFNTPAASVLMVQTSDVIATSVNNVLGNGIQLIQQRQQWEDFEDDEEL